MDTNMGHTEMMERCIEALICILTPGTNDQADISEMSLYFSPLLQERRQQGREGGGRERERKKNSKLMWLVRM